MPVISRGTERQVSRNHRAFSRKTYWVDITNARGLQKDITRGFVLEKNSIRVKNHTTVVVKTQLPNREEVMTPLGNMEDTTKAQWLNRTSKNTMTNMFDRQ